MTNIFKRLSNLITASINDLIDRAEDPERLVKQIIREMEEHIRHAKEGVIEAIASEKQLAKQLREQRRIVNEWQKKAEYLVENDQEALARAALERKKEYEKILQSLEPAWQAANKTSERLKEQLQALESKLEEAKIKRGTLVARQRAAEARHHMEKTAIRFEAGNSAYTEFGRMEDKVAEIEARAEAIEEIKTNRSKLEQEIMEMEADPEIEEELQALKKQVKNKSS